MSDKKLKIGVSDVLLALLGILFLVGILTFFAPCRPKDDGSWMVCHWAGNSVTGVAAVICFLSLVHLFVFNSRIRMGLDIALFALAILADLIPGHLINLCKMETMRCHTVMSPSVFVISILILIVSLADFLIQKRKAD